MAKIEEAKMEESKDHSLIAFRQNANNLTRRKEAQAEILQEKMVEEDELRKEINEKKKMMEKEFGTAPMNEAQFKGFWFYSTFRNELLRAATLGPLRPPCITRFTRDFSLELKIRPS